MLHGLFFFNVFPLIQGVQETNIQSTTWVPAWRVKGQTSNMVNYRTDGKRPQARKATFSLEPCNQPRPSLIPQVLCSKFEWRPVSSINVNRVFTPPKCRGSLPVPNSARAAYLVSCDHGQLPGVLSLGSLTFGKERGFTLPRVTSPTPGLSPN